MSTHHSDCWLGDQHTPSPRVARTRPMTRGTDRMPGEVAALIRRRSMRIARNGGTAGADEEVEVGPQVRLLDVLHVELGPAAIGRGQRLPLGAAARQFLVAHL